ncbi:hypothetical protein ACSVDE_02035 [Pseudalkalibacillus sp. Hm43]
MNTKKFWMTALFLLLLLTGCSGPGEEQEIIIGDEDAPATEEEDQS